MRDALRRFEERAPEIVFEWTDTPTGARGWVVINSLRGGAAGGGKTRLARAQKFTGTACLQIEIGKFKTAIGARHGLQTLVFSGIFVRGNQQTV